MQFTFDAKGRLWVTTMPSYPQYLPGTPVNDKMLILEDTNGDGKADKQTVFADKLHRARPASSSATAARTSPSSRTWCSSRTPTATTRPTSARSSCTASIRPTRTTRSARSPGIQGGALYFEEGTFHHTQVETPYGPERVRQRRRLPLRAADREVRRVRLLRLRQPWGHIFDRWGQNFVADASGGSNYFGTAFSRRRRLPRQARRHEAVPHQAVAAHLRLRAGLQPQLSRRSPGQLPAQQLHRLPGSAAIQDEGRRLGLRGRPGRAAARSRATRTSARSISSSAPDGALYLCDWFNPLVGHMQHSLRDPNRDHIARPHLADPLHQDSRSSKPREDRRRSRSPRCSNLLQDRARRADPLPRADANSASRPTDEVLGRSRRSGSPASTRPTRVYEHHRLEALWLHQAARRGQRSRCSSRCSARPTTAARAAATRVLCYWRDRVAEAAGPAADASQRRASPRPPRSRPGALSFFDSQEAIDVAVESLIYRQDDYLKYTLKETMNTLEKRVKK